MNGFDVVCGILIFLIIGLGICGNVISFLVWTTGRHCRKLPGSIYLRALAVSDTVALFLPALNEAISLVSTINTKEANNVLCKLEIFGRHYGLMVSSWIVVSFTLERTVAIFKPTTVTGTGGLLGKKRTITLMGVIFVVCFLMNIPYGAVYEIKHVPVTNHNQSVTDTSNPHNMNQSGNLHTNSTIGLGAQMENYQMKCDADIASFFHFAKWYHIWLMDIFLIFAIPFTLMTGSNLVVVYLLVSRKGSIVSKMDSKIKGVTMRAVVISVMHCITSGSFTMSPLFPEFLDKAFSEKYSVEYYGHQITLILAYINHAMNFLLYSSFGTDFRRDCADLFLRKTTTVYPESSAQQQRKIGGKDKSTKTGQSTDENDIGTGSKTEKTGVDPVHGQSPSDCVIGSKSGITSVSTL